MLAVVAAAVALAAMVEAMPRPGSSSWSTALAQSHATVRHALYLLTLIPGAQHLCRFPVLPLAVDLFHKAARAEMARFANELSIFWGTVYFPDADRDRRTDDIFCCSKSARRGVAELTDPKVAAEIQTLLDSKGMVAGLKQQVELVLALLAPMIAGPVANAFQAALVS